ncbi:unnamed protein product [Dicrocoelium dendriticum]|nr:unnamed protein product [Dicrocoelium dendriticum]
MKSNAGQVSSLIENRSDHAVVIPSLVPVASGSGERLGMEREVDLDAITVGAVLTESDLVSDWTTTNRDPDQNEAALEPKPLQFSYEEQYRSFLEGLRRDFDPDGVFDELVDLVPSDGEEGASHKLTLEAIKSPLKEDGASPKAGLKDAKWSIEILAHIITELKRFSHGDDLAGQLAEQLQYAGGKKTAVNSTSEDDAPGETAQSTAKRIRLLRPSYNTTTITITRKQHLTISQYKPADTTLTYSIICLPISICEFWTLQCEQKYAERFATLRAAFPLCSFNHATLRLSHYIPPQKSLQGTTATDVTAFNSAPYMYTAQDHTGLLNTVPTDVTEAAHLNQDYKVSSNTYWQFTYDQGLLACNDVHTLSANEVYFKRFDFDHHPCFLTRTPLPVPRGYRYMPDKYYANTSRYPFLPFWKQQSLNQSVPATHPTTISTAWSFGTYNHTLNPILLFLPYIEPVSTSEDILRMMGHELLET